MGKDEGGAAMERGTELSGCIVMIPALDPGPDLAAYAAALLARGPEALVVVDDGSGPGSREVFAALEAMDRCTVLRHPVNRGKGRAMKTAFAYILNQSAWTGCAVVTADADGQHLAQDIAAVSRQMLEGGHVVLGVRDFTAPQVPPRSRMGNQITVGVFRLFFGMRIGDTQTGLRAFPREVLPELAGVPGDRYEYETQMLFLMSRKKLPFDQVEIATVYLEENRSSHFRVVRDSLRIYALIIRYLLSSVSAAVIDALAYFLLKSWGALALLPFPTTWTAAALARILSSLCNFLLNARVVFGGNPSGRALVRYYTLAVVQLSLSTALVYLAELAFAISAPALSTLVKVLVDTILFFFSFRIQHKWVFNSEK